MKKYDIHGEANEELYAAADWYQSQRDGLGHDFLNEYDLQIHRILENPHQFAADEDNGSRACLIPRFTSYIIRYYIRSDGKIWIVAVSHGSRRPNYWLHRLEN